MSVTDPAMTPAQGEARRVVNICNACRYCEGFCAVFPAVERRLDFAGGDLDYLASLCHDCRECYYSCQYAPPHEFDLNLPRALAGLRQETYRRYAWPAFMAPLFDKTGGALFASMVVIPLIFLLASLLIQGGAATTAAYSDGEGAFYALVPHAVMAWGFGLASVFILVALWQGWRNFRRETGGGGGLTIADSLRAAGDSLRLRYLGGGGDGCAYPEERASTSRRRYHHLTFYGFLLCFAATTAGAVYHYLFGLKAPYPFLSVPVLFGTLGGIGLLIGPIGLLRLKRVRDPAPADARQTGMDVTFLVLLFMVSLTGFLLLFLRETAAMGIILLVHLGLVMGLFLTLPYGKFVHALYRYGALIRNAQEERES